ncbi:MAG: TonB-dependent receptor [Cytophagia bacterium]|nr:MAG: TonB-dependent receptor [Cytophagales bacterium]TAG39789.1 MAG: TonB-dependent receptor [Cytophagia bacterium]TAG81431.1 MAG: TonB-dependent receptor [Cytophagales bacterium]
MLVGAGAIGQQRDISKDTLQLDEVVIAASKFEEQKRTLPFQIEQVTARQIAFRNPQNSADLLMQTGQVFVQKSQGGGGSPVLRGFEANRVLLVIDGVRMNNAIYRAGHLQNVLRIDPSLLERVEVVMGPSSVVYGSEALGGVMHFRTRNPALSNDQKLLINANVYGRYSSVNEEKTGHFDVSVGGKKWGILTSLTRANFGDLRQGNRRLAAYPNFGKLPFYAARQNNQDVAIPNSDPNLQIGSGYQQTDFYTKILFQPSANAKHTLNVQYSGTSDVPRYDRLTETANNLPRFAEWYYGPEKRFMAAYHAELTRPTAFYDQLLVTTAFQDIKESRISRRFGNNLRTSQLERVKVYTFNADALKKWGRHALKYGVEAMHNDVFSTAFRTDIVQQTVVPSSTRYPDGGSQMRYFALYLTDQISFSEQFFLNAGLRYNAVGLKANFIDKTFFPLPFNDVRQTPNALSGNVGVVYSPSVKTKLSALFSTGFKAPNVDDLAKVFDSQPGSVIVPNPNLRSEFTYNYELSASQLVGNIFKLEATFFYTDLRNAIVTEPFALNGQSQIQYDSKLSQVTANQNRRQANVQGFNAAATARFFKNWTLYSTYNQTIGRIKEEKGGTSPLDHIPPSFGRTSLTYANQKWQAEFFVMYNGWKRLADYKLDGEDNQLYATPEGMPAWATLNLRASYEVSKNCTIQAACENLTDQNYRYFASGISAPGRNLVLTLRGRI